MSSSSSPVTLDNLDWYSAPTETSSPAWPSTSPVEKPKEIRPPTYTVINTVGTLQTCLNTVVRTIIVPPKKYSQAHTFPPTNNPYRRTPTEPKPSTNLTQAPPPLFNIPQSTPQLYIDAEGISLSRSGELSILILHIETPSFSHTYLLHIHVLGRRTFTTRSSNLLHTLKTIFEDNRIPKVLFDCRMDSDALFGQHGVLLGGVIDLQLMRLAARGGGGRYLPGLELCLINDLSLTFEEHEWVSEAKRKGQLLWRPRMGGSMQRFNDNPLHEDIVNYCVVDAAYLPRLFDIYNQDLGNRVHLTAVDRFWGNENMFEMSKGVFSWEGRVLQQSRERVEFALDPHFRGGTAYNPWYVYHYYDDDSD
ncbi:MAG: hypothetical protein Q9186_002861 [Xanthomendoza sp. 1 TL-2023]